MSIISPIISFPLTYFIETLYKCSESHLCCLSASDFSQTDRLPNQCKNGALMCNGSSLVFSELLNTELKGERSRTEGRKPVKWHSEVSFCQSCSLPLSKLEMCLVHNSAHVSQFWVALTRYFPENPLLRSPLARWVICLSPTSLAHCLFGMAVAQLLIVSYKRPNPWKREAMFNHNRQSTKNSNAYTQ